MRIRYLPPVLLLLCVFALWGSVHASPMFGFTSDLIDNSAPATPTPHLLKFSAATAIPPLGSITIVPQDGAFTIPAGFDYSDVDFAVWNGSAYINRPLAAAPDAVNDGVSVVTGTSGSITINLSSSAGIAPGAAIQVKLGTNATFGASSTDSIINPAGVGGYHIGLDSYDDTGAHLDYNSPIITVIEPVSILVPILNLPPNLSNGLPAGEIAAGNPVIEISVESDKTATCRYATTTNVAYANMTGTFSPLQGTQFYTVVGGHQDGTTYNYYVRCIGVQAAVTPIDYVISFFLDPTPSSNTSVSQGGSQSGVGPFPNGSQTLYLSSMTFSGFTAPGSTVTVLKDGVQSVSVQAGAEGAFSAVLPGLERGTYTFDMYATDNRQRKSSSYTSTFTFAAATNNIVSGVVLPPTIGLDQNSISVGDAAHVSGQAAPNSKITVFVVPQPGTIGDTRQLISSSTSAGAWSLDLSNLAGGGYSIRARAERQTTQSNVSASVSLGVGKTASKDVSVRADVNGDNKVNLTDFSILLSFWNTSEASVDINGDGTVNLADFSILLFNWTG